MVDDPPKIAGRYTKMMAPIVAEIAEEHPEYKICKVNVDEQSELSEQFMVLSIPFYGVFKNGELKRTSVWYQGKELLLKMFEYSKKKNALH